MPFLRIYLSLSLILFAAILPAMRSDSFNIKKTELHLSIRNFGAKTIGGKAVHHISFIKQSDKLSLDLRQMNVDSVKSGNAHFVFNRIGEKLNIMLDKVYTPGDSCELSIYYRGIPAADPGGWGGFYFSGDFAFNLGVGFSVNPHSFGRAWFPCVDEFTMKSAYEFYIETDSNYTAACNGVLVGKQRQGTGMVWHYLETVPLGAYLASVSVSKFSIISSAYNGINAGFPVSLYTVANDTNKVKASFVRLPMAIQAFEKAFGPQIYSKVGYNFVPFSSGAMEHAGNITYPSAFASGGTDYEELMAHELSHHWWGNNVTCKSEGDMWLNEGWASYCEHFFNEQIYGRSAYNRSILDNHVFVLRFAHVNDANIFSMINIPTQYTYGNHVYKKGADVVHSLRGVLGDSVFFRACKAYQQQYRLGNASSQDMENVFALNGGDSLARSFFSSWVYEKGFPHFIISKQVHSGNGPYKLKLHTLQNPRFTGKIYRNLPVEIYFFKNRNHFEKRMVLLRNETDSFEFTFNFKPEFVCTDFESRLSDAISERTLHTDSIGTHYLPQAFANILIRNASDSALIRVEHHWVGPEKFRISSPYVSNYRYHSVDGLWDDSLKFDLELNYDGRQGGANSGTGYLDHTLIYKTEDSLTVLYRAWPGDQWRVWNDLQFTYGSKNDKQGKVLIKNARKGDYVFAMYDKNLALTDKVFNSADTSSWKIMPNPSKDILRVEFIRSTVKGIFYITDLNGKVLMINNKPEGMEPLSIDVSTLAAGTYIISFNTETGNEFKNFVISR